MFSPGVLLYTTQMLYVYAGADRAKARAKWRATIASFKTKHPEAEEFTLTGERFNQADFEQLTLGQTLFAKKYLVVVDELTVSGDFANTIKEWQMMHESPNIFIVFEGKLDKALLKKLDKLESKITVFDLPEKSGSKSTGAREYSGYNIFALTDYFGARDRKKLWIEYQKALRADIPAEEIFWKIFWQVKNLLFVVRVGKAPKGTHPFVADKTARAAKNFTETELVSLSSQLSSIYHLARRGQEGVDSQIEKLILSI